jgi:hypothetical protein
MLVQITAFSAAEAGADFALARMGRFCVTSYFKGISAYRFLLQ